MSITHRDSWDDLTTILKELNAGDIALVTTLAESLRDTVVTTAELSGLSSQAWAALIATRRVA